jgi:hypothetical protein
MNIVAGGSSDDLYSNYPTNTSYIRVTGFYGSLAFSAQLLVVNVNNGSTSHFEIKATFKSPLPSVTPTYTLIGAPTIITIDEDSPGTISPKVDVDPSTGEILVRVFNGHNHDVQCVCYVRYTETFFFI